MMKPSYEFQGCTLPPTGAWRAQSSIHLNTNVLFCRSYFYFYFILFFSILHGVIAANIARTTRLHRAPNSVQRPSWSHRRYVSEESARYGRAAPLSHRTALFCIDFYSRPFGRERRRSLAYNKFLALYSRSIGDLDYNQGPIARRQSAPPTGWRPAHRARVLKPVL